MRSRIARAFLAALDEFENQWYWPDWDERRTLFEGMDLMDTLVTDENLRPRADDAYTLMSELLVKLNDKNRSKLP